MSLETEKAFWEFVAQERAQARVVEEEPASLEDWLEQEIEKALETKARLEREAAVLKAKKARDELHKAEKDIEYWNGYVSALEDVRKMLREVF